MTWPLDDDLLLAALGRALAPPAVEPGPEAMAGLHAALVARTTAASDSRPGVVAPFTGPKRRSATWAGIHRLRHPVAAAVAVGVLATSGVAAAGVATDHLPGPTRNVAYALGLPVTSPAVAAAKGTIAQLRAALVARDVTQVVNLSSLLRTRLSELSAADRASIQPTADDLLAQADRFDQAAAGGVANGTGSSTGTAGSTGSGTPANPGAASGSSSGGTISSNVVSRSGSGTSSSGAAPALAGSSGGGPVGTTHATNSPGTPGPAHGSGGGSTPGTTPTTTPSTKPPPTPTTTPTTTPGTTPTTEPDDRGEGTDDSLAAKSTTSTTRPIPAS